MSYRFDLLYSGPTAIEIAYPSAMRMRDLHACRVNRIWEPSNLVDQLTTRSNACERKHIQMNPS